MYIRNTINLNGPSCVRTGTLERERIQSKSDPDLVPRLQLSQGQRGLQRLVTLLMKGLARIENGSGEK